MTKQRFAFFPKNCRKAGQWGRWYLSTTEPPSLDIYPNGDRSEPYEVILPDAGTGFTEFTQWLGHWCDHLYEKLWIGPDEMFDFIEAAWMSYCDDPGSGATSDGGTADHRRRKAAEWWARLEKPNRRVS